MGRIPVGVRMNPRAPRLLCQSIVFFGWAGLERNFVVLLYSNNKAF